MCAIVVGVVVVVVTGVVVVVVVVVGVVVVIIVGGGGGTGCWLGSVLVSFVFGVVVVLPIPTCPQCLD